MNQHNSEPTTQTPIELAVIINSFNRLSLLRQALPSITQALELLPLNSAVVVFEAGSNDGSIEFIKDFSMQNQKPQIYLCTSTDTDRSFAAGCNFAVQVAAKRYPELKWCFFFETDNLILNESALPLAVKLLEQEEKLAAVGFTVELRSRQKLPPFGCRFPTPLSFCLGRQLSRRLGLEQMQISDWYSFSEVRWGISDIVYTSPLLVKYSAWQATGGMDAERFPFSDSDVDWCWTANKYGWRLAVLDLPGVIHDNGTQGSEWSVNRAINFHQARLSLLLKHVGQWILLLKPILLIRHCLEFFVLALGAFWSERARKSLFQRQRLVNAVFNEYKT